MPRISDITTPQAGDVELFRQQFERWRRSLIRELADLEDQITALEATTSSAGAPVDAQYVVAATNATLTAERVLTAGTGITVDFTTPGQAIVNSTISTYTDEQAQDAVGNILTDSASIDFTYNDGANTITAAVLPAGVDATALANFTEGVQDVVGAMVTAGAGISVSYNDPAGTETISSTITQYTDEQAQDAVGTILTDSSRIDFTYNDGANTITADIVASSIGTTQLADNAVTMAKLANLGAGELIGAESAGDPVAIVVGAGLLITGGELEVDVSTISGLDEHIDDRVDTLIVDGHGIDTTYNDGANTLTIAVDETELTGSLLPNITYTQVDPVTLWEMTTSEATNDWNAGGDGTYSFGGVNWTIVHTDVADTLGPVNGTGLRFNASANSTVFQTGSQTATHIYSPITTAIPTWRPEWTLMFEIYFSVCTLGTSPNSVGFGLWNNNSSQLVAVGRRNSSGTQQHFVRRTTTTEAGNADGSGTHTAHALKVDHHSFHSWHGTYSSGFPNYPNVGVQGTFTTSTTTPSQGAIADPANLRVVIFWSTGETGGAMDVTIAHARIRRIG